MGKILICLISLCLIHCGAALAEVATWRAGVARVNISPELPIWLSGYGGRNKPAAEKLDDLWAKALVLEDAHERRALLITIDLVGIDRELSQTVCRRIEDQYKLPRAAVALCTSHTHSGPVIRGNLVPMFNLDEDQTRRVKEYKMQVADKLVQVGGEAINSLAPARLNWGMGMATFAVNRRNNKEGDVVKLRKEGKLVGPVDYDVPVLVVRDGESNIRAIATGYACHATVLDGYKISADWPGAAQTEIERRHEGAIALYWTGCGGDQNPLPRRSVELMKQHGRALADAVDVALNGVMPEIAPLLETTYEEIQLPFDALPTRSELETAAATAQRPQGPWAKYLLGIWDRDGGLSQTYPYPIQVWHLGSDVTWVFLGGEAVVDYSLRIKTELGAAGWGLGAGVSDGSHPQSLVPSAKSLVHSPKSPMPGLQVWVASYSNDVMAYIPSRRVLTEGGYEGGLARFPYGVPAPWGPDVENVIMATVHKLAEP